MGLKLLYGVNLQIKTEKLYELSREVEKRSGFKIALNKPIIGYTAFARESGISVAGWMKYALGSEPILPELVGNSHKVIIGKKSGRHSIIYKMRELGIDDSKFDETIIKKILEEVKQKSETLKRALTDNEFIEIVKKYNV
jgi:isopropylmalate/homocitrate/citramalate synthase